MILARVVGHVVATQKQSSHEGKKILLIQPLTPEGQAGVSAAATGSMGAFGSRP